MTLPLHRPGRRSMPCIQVTSDQPGRCPKCGMKLLATVTPAAAVSYACPMHPDVTSDQPGRCPRCG